MENQLTPFVDTLLKDKNLPGMTQEVFNQLRHDLVRDLRHQIDRALIDAMSDEQIDQFTKLMDDPGATGEALQQFVSETGIDSAAIIATTMSQFRAYYLGEA